MDKKQVEKQRKEAENSFNALQEQKTVLQNEIKERQDKITEIDTESLRLQGEYRAFGKLLEPKEKANVIDVTDVKGA